MWAITLLFATLVAVPSSMSIAKSHFRHQVLTRDSLIAYKIISLKPLRVEESAVGTGGLCGSAFLNYRFEEHVRGRLGQTLFDEMKTRKGKTWQMGLKYFEEFVKRNFNEDEHQEVNVP